MKRAKTRSIWLGSIAFAAAAALSAGPLLADTVWVKSGKNPLPFQNVKVTGIQGDQVQFTTSAGRQDSRPIAQVPQLAVDDEPALTAAEEAFVKGDWAGAAENYRKAMQSTTKDWVKSRSSLRLLEAADKSGNFGDAVAGFVDLLQTNPAAANDRKPTIPKGHPEQLDPAIAQVKQASANPQLTGDQKAVLLNYLVELYNAKGDNASAAAVLQQLGKVAPAEASSPANRGIQATVTLTAARQAFANKQYAKTVQTLDGASAAFTDAQQQADALFLLAQAKEALAKPDDADQLKDAAIAYMRVVANFKGMEGKPHVGESLLKVAQIEEKLKNSKEALSLYRQVATEFKGTPAAAQADQDANRLAAAKG